MRDAFLTALTDLARADRDVVLLTADLGFGVFENFEYEFPGQYFNVGVAEQAMMGLATGLGLEGKKVFTYSIGNFPTLRCLEQIRNDAAYHEINVNIVASGGGFSYGQLGMSHHATEDLAIMRALPGVEVCAPCTVGETGKLTRELYSRPGVGYIRLDKTSAPDSEDTVPFIFSKIREFRSGTDLTLIGTGGIVEELLDAAGELAFSGLNVRVLGVHCVKPLDRDSIIAACKETGGIVTVEEHNIVGGLGSAIAEVCIDEGISPKHFSRLGLKDLYSSVVGDQRFLRAHYGLDSPHIVAHIINLVKFSEKL
jgi:transketolase